MTQPYITARTVKRVCISTMRAMRIAAKNTFSLAKRLFDAVIKEYSKPYL
ncbi:hypothetical protein [Pseudomonas japonica]|uniref:Transposase n=1 Tax=Pseudomonas japonica TaxID=256466 RepID=A0A239JIA4_9PSED|nr:hypothetical protein [Pseudomonas japonica]SNT05128.1 hypothetical protein SAMN05444352_12252 [Pseudomonas japonica]